MQPGPRLVVLVAYDGVQLLDFAGPADILDAASRALAGQDKPLEDGEFVTPSPQDELTVGYRLVVATPSGQSVRAGNGVGIAADAALGDVDARTVDALIVSGGPFVDDALGDRRLVDEIRRISARARRTCSVCSGAFLLAAAGVLEGRRATTHWAACEELARRYSGVTVEPDRIYVRDGKVATSAGVTAGLDLALALVDEDCGPEIAVKVARWMVMFQQRPEGSPSFRSAWRCRRASDRRSGLSWTKSWLSPGATIEFRISRSGQPCRSDTLPACSYARRA